jgi:DNA-binding NtrC family response regulator
VATILVAEDDDNLRWCLKEIFNRTAYSTLFADPAKRLFHSAGNLKA